MVLPRQLGRYEVLQLLGRGGMGEVVAVRLLGEARFERLYAAKRIRLSELENPRLHTMFFDEARIAASIHSRHVVSVLDVGRDDSGQPFMIMPLVLGPDLHALVKRMGFLAHELVVSVLLDASQGLADAHAATDPMGQPYCVVHRDIKPSNVLIGPDGRAMLTDFGIAGGRDRDLRTFTGELKGSFAYFAPEQVMGETSPQSDIFSLGVVAWEMLAERRLFVGQSVRATLDAVSHDEIPRLHDVAPRVPRPLSDVVARALERDRSRRYASALAFHEALRECAGALPGVHEELADLARSWSAPLLGQLSERLSQSASEVEKTLTTALRRSADPANGLGFGAETPTRQGHDAPTRQGQGAPSARDARSQGDEAVTRQGSGAPMDGGHVSTSPTSGAASDVSAPVSPPESAPESAPESTHDDAARTRDLPNARAATSVTARILQVLLVFLVVTALGLTAVLLAT